MKRESSLDQNRAQHSPSLELFRTKKLLEVLASKEGRHTELISLYVPPGKQISEVMNTLREEYGTASNIKSRTTRHNVEDAIERVLQRLKLFKEPPPTGLAIFCGSIPYGPPGMEKMETYMIIPPEPIQVYFYRCDSRFHVEPLLEMVKEKETFGIILIDGTGSTFAILRGKRLEIVKAITSGLSSKHRAGGQSARRFERLREMEVNEYYKRVANYAAKIFLEIPDLKGIIIGGPGPTKLDFAEGGYLHYKLKDKVLAIVDTAYVDEQGIKEIVGKSEEILKKVRYVEEKNVVQNFLRELGQDSGLSTYGIDEVKKHLEANHVKTLLLSEELNQVNAVVKCSTCGYVEERNVKQSDMLAFESALTSKPCPKCGRNTLTVEDKKDMIDVLSELAEKNNANIEVISASHEEGEMLLKSFGGVAAILKYKS
ncbi:MAG: peptide chain release factor aRF-1 [Candidatus Bathyarchaeia archaeon]